MKKILLLHPDPAAPPRARRAAAAANPPAVPPPAVAAAKTIVIGPAEESRDGFRVTQGDRYHDGLTWDEMLGLIAELTHPKIRRPRYRMHTSAEWAAYRKRIGLLP
jgi:hypothetical protein